MTINTSEDPKMHLIERGPDGVQLRAVEGLLVCEHAESFSASQTVFADDGQLLACLHTDEVHIYDTRNNSILHRLPTPGTIAAYFSPAGSYLVIYQKANASGAGEEKNLSVWQLDGAKKVFACFQRTLNNSNRRTLQFSDDETIASRAVTNEVHFYRTNDFLAQPFRLRVPHVSSHKISPGKLPTFVAFVPEMKGQPGSVQKDSSGLCCAGLRPTDRLVRILRKRKSLHSQAYTRTRLRTHRFSVRMLRHVPAPLCQEEPEGEE